MVCLLGIFYYSPWRNIIKCKNQKHKLNKDKSYLLKNNFLDSKPRHSKRRLKLYLSVGGNALAPNRCNSLSCKVRTSRQKLCNQRVGCLLCSVVSIYEWDGS